MEPHIGSEQGGTRPVVVLQNDVGNRYAPTLIVATVTSRTEKKRYQPTHVLIAHNTAFEKPSVVQLEQIFTIDKSRIQRFLGQTTRHEMRRIEEALMNSLEINEWDRRNAKVMVSPEIQSEAVVLPQIVSIKQASQRMGLPEYYIRRLCREVPGMAFQSGIKWYINLGKMADYFNGGTTTL